MNKRTQPLWSPSVQKSNLKLPDLKLFNSLTLKKIIKRARQNYLLENYRKRDLDLVIVITDISNAIQRLKAKSDTDPDPEKRNYLKNEVERLISLLTFSTPNCDPVVHLINGARDAIADLLDANHGSSITDNRIFELLSQHFENEYHQDMKALNILPPDVLIRVTEYIEPIINYIEKIIENGFAYASTSGSVYFDTNKFANDSNHFYAKLVPTAFGDSDQLAIGEGELSLTGEKRSTTDFALWKASKAGEPAWSSPWGKGRPGWHIECSAMASGILGETLDIHGGGVDLKFPHHDNEIAQSEAYFGRSSWVNYFLHSGHLTISGCKMSKSLKNFITIRDALKSHSARHIRLTFLLHSWRDTMDYSVDTLVEANNYEKQMIDFLYNCTSFQYIIKQIAVSEQPQSLSTEQDLLPYLDKAQHDVYNALCDSCDTRAVLDIIKDLTTLTDQRICSQLESKNSSLYQLADQSYLVARFVLRVLRILGVADHTAASIGSPVPIGSTIAGQIMTEQDLNDTLVQDDPSVYSTRGWLSLDALDDKRLGSSLFMSLKATVSFVNTLLSGDEMLQELARKFVLELRNQFGISLFDLPENELACLKLLVQTYTKRDYSKSVDVCSFGLEFNVWPVVLRCLHYLVSVRQIVRQQLMTNLITDSVCKQRLYKACDQFRDHGLGRAGVRLQDRTSANQMMQGLNLLPHIGLADSKIIMAELDDKLNREKQRQKTETQKVAVKCDETGSLPPKQMFIHQLDKYSKFNLQGMPTHDHLGNELTKSALKRLQKLHQVQAKRHATYLATKA